MKAIQVLKHGGPETLQVVQVEAPTPAAGEAVVRHEAIGVNFIDVYHRTGLYPNPLPFTPGMEGAGVVEAVAPDVKEIKVGDRVAYAMNLGAYSELAKVPAWKLVKMPASVSAKDGAAIMLQGLTADYLVHGAYHLKKGETALVHAAAGGVGLLLVQMAKRLGARVIGTVSTPEKAALARAAGAEEVIIYTSQDFEVEVRRLTGGEGAHVAYDSVGVTTFMKSMSSLRPRGYLVSYGQSSGSVPPFEPSLLSQKGSLFLTRPTLGHYMLNRTELLERADRVLGMVARGELSLRREHEFRLADAASAHRALEGRKTTGKVILVP